METQLDIQIVRYVIERQLDVMKPESWVPCVLPHSTTLCVYTDRGEAEDMLMTAQMADRVRLRETTESDHLLRSRRWNWGCA